MRNVTKKQAGFLFMGVAANICLPFLAHNAQVAGQDLSVSIEIMGAGERKVVDEHSPAIIKIVDPTTTGGTTYATINALPFEGLVSTTMHHDGCTTKVDEQFSLDSDQILSFSATEDCGNGLVVLSCDDPQVIRARGYTTLGMQALGGVRFD